MKMKMTITLDPEEGCAKRVSWRPGLPDNEVYPEISVLTDELERKLRESIAVGHKLGYSSGRWTPDDLEEDHE